MMIEPEFDLYDDLDEALIQPLEREVAKQRAENEAEEAELRELRESLETERKKHDELKLSMEQIKINWSSFSITARAELERKDQRMKDMQRELDSFIFRRRKPNRMVTLDVGTQTTEVVCKPKDKDVRGESSSSKEKSSRHRSPKDVRGESSSSKEKSSQQRSPERSRNSREKEKKTIYDRSKQRFSSENHEIGSSSRKHSIEKYRDDKDSKKRDDKKSRKRSRSKSPSKRSRQVGGEKRRKHESPVKSNGRRRSDDKLVDLRKHILKKRARETSREQQQQSEPKTAEVVHSNYMNISEMVCINSSDSDDVMVVIKADDVTPVLEETAEPNEESVTQVIEQPNGDDQRHEGAAEVSEGRSDETKTGNQNKSMGSKEPSYYLLLYSSASSKTDDEEINETEETSRTKHKTKDGEDIHGANAVNTNNETVENQQSVEIDLNEHLSEPSFDSAEILEVPIEQELEEEFAEETKREVSFEETNSLEPAAPESQENFSATPTYIPLGEALHSILPLETEANPKAMKELPIRDVVSEPQLQPEVVKIITKSESQHLLSSSYVDDQLDSSGSKENSLNHSQQNGKEFKSKRLSYTKAATEESGDVVLIFSQPRRKNKKKPKTVLP